jgi:hypothetical protein
MPLSFAEHIRCGHPTIHARSPAKIVGADSATRYIVSGSGFCVRTKTFTFADDVKI